MLSILIPTYNYNMSPLVTSLHELCLASKKPFEILVFDDGSQAKINTENDKLNALEHVTFKAKKQNVGLSNNRNNLINASKYEYILLLDADMLIVNDNFISNYLITINNNYLVVYGGIKYVLNRPKKQFLLRWRYGIKNECKTVKERLKNKYRSILSSNLLLHKSVFEKVQFETTLTSYGYEDTLFSYNLKQLNVNIHHIENVVIHNDFTTNKAFLLKTKSALNNLSYLTSSGLIKEDFIRVHKAFNKLKAYKFNTILLLIYKFFSKPIEKLLIKFPSLKLYNLYKISYYCYINHKN